MLGLAAVGVLFSGSTDTRSPHKRRDRLFAVIGHTTKNVLNLIIILVLVAIAGVVAVSLVFSAQTALSLAFMISSLGLIPILSILVYKTTLWDRPETNLRNMLVSSWLLVALVPTVIGVLGIAVPHMPWLVQRVIPYALRNSRWGAFDTLSRAPVVDTRFDPCFQAGIRGAASRPRPTTEER